MGQVGAPPHLQYIVWTKPSILSGRASELEMHVPLQLLLLFSCCPWAIGTWASSSLSTRIRAPRLPLSPFPVSQQPERITTLDLTGSSWDLRVLGLSAAGIVAQRSPELAVVDAQDGVAPDGSRGGIAFWHLGLLPAELDTSMQGDILGVLHHFRSDFRGYVMCDSPGSTASLDDAMTESAHVAVSLAGVLKALVVTPNTKHIAESAGLELIEDARSLSPTDAFQRHLHRYSDTLLLNQHANKLTYTIDLAIYSRAFTLFDPKLDSRLSHAALARMKPISMVLGWGDEYEMVSAASRHGHQVLCSDFSLNLPVYMNFAPPPRPADTKLAPSSASSKEQRLDDSGCPASDGKHGDQHTVAFMFTDGDSISWTLGNFASPAFDWWASPARGSVPIAWTFQPMLQELHPYFLAWVLDSRGEADELLVGPSGAGYSYLDLYPSQLARQSFARWTADTMAQSGGVMLNMINQIQAGIYNGTIEAEGLDPSRPPEAVFVDEHDRLTIHGGTYLLPGHPETIVTSRRHILSKIFGDVTPEELVQLLNDPNLPRDSSSMDSYSLIGVEVWGYGVSDIVGIASKLNQSAVRVVSLSQYVSCLQRNINLTDSPAPWPQEEDKHGAADAVITNPTSLFRPIE